MVSGPFCRKNLQNDLPLKLDSLYTVTGYLTLETRRFAYIKKDDCLEFREREHQSVQMYFKKVNKVKKRGTKSEK